MVASERLHRGGLLQVVLVQRNMSMGRSPSLRFRSDVADLVCMAHPKALGEWPKGITLHYCPIFVECLGFPGFVRVLDGIVAVSLFTPSTQKACPHSSRVGTHLRGKVARPATARCIEEVGLMDSARRINLDMRAHTRAHTHTYIYTP